MFRSFNERLRSKLSAAFLGKLGIVVVTILGLLAGISFAEPQGPQDQNQFRDEIVADLAAGRVVIAVLKDAIFVGSIENKIEPDTQPPTIVPIGDRRVGIILGAMRWQSPSARVELARLDRELPGIHSHTSLAPNAPHLNGGQADKEATDIEDIGNGLLETLDPIVKQMHGQIDLGDQPLTEVVLADYVVGYGPEVWDLQYLLQQAAEQGDYWDSKLTPPQYSQLWPPEKDAPHTLIEMQYPPGKNSPSLHDMLRRGDPRLQPLLSGGEGVIVANQFLDGDTRKILAADAVPFLRSCLSALASKNEREEIAVIGMTTGFQWLIPPPPEAKPSAPTIQNALAPPAAPRPAGAPTLLGRPQ